MHPKFAAAILFFLASLRAVSQVEPSALKSGVGSLSVGAGVSNYNPDIGRGRMYGGTLWVDYALKRVPSFLRGTGLEIEARDVSLDRPPTEAVLREDSIGGGVTYSLLKLGNFRPYAKLIFGLGNADYLVTSNRRFNQSRTLTSFGGGFDYHAYRALWVRVDYEYQYFPDFFVGSKAKPSAPLDPQGFTVGALYHFGKKSDRR